MSENTPTLVKNVKNGEYVRFADSKAAPVWIAEGYQRDIKKYMFSKCEDMNRSTVKRGETTCYIGFTY